MSDDKKRASMTLTDFEHLFVQDLVEHVDGEMQSARVRNAVLLEFAGRVLGLYLVGGQRFGLDKDQEMIDETVKRARAFRDSAKDIPPPITPGDMNL